MKTIKSITFWVVAIIAIIVVAGVYKFNFTNGGDIIPGTNAPDAKNASYVIDGETFVLINGKTEKEITPGSATKQIIYTFGEPVYGDLNNDGKIDAAVILVSNSGGSGTFYYAVLVVSKGGIYKTTNAILLGDRIAPQTVEIHDSIALFNYAERNIGEPMTTSPSLGKSLWINYDAKTGKISELVKPKSN